VCVGIELFSSDIRNNLLIYENQDSILVIPLMGNSLHEGRFIGKKVDLQMVIDPPKFILI
jgi:hypothetical protein